MANDKEPLRIDPERVRMPESTGIYARAIDPKTERWESVDIIHLDRVSLMRFCRSRGDKSVWMESIIMALLLHYGRHPEETEGP